MISFSCNISDLSPVRVVCTIFCVTFNLHTVFILAEHDESGVRQVGGKAPGFVIQPLCSTPATENKNIDLPKKGNNLMFSF
jgi:hypothetical protein